MIGEFPIIRIELDSMKHSIVSCLAGSHAEIEKYVANVIDHFDFKKVVAQETIRCLDSQIHKSVEWAVAQVFSDKKVKEALKTAVLEVLQAGTERE